MVPVRKILLCAGALLGGLLAAEGIVRWGVGYPTYGVEYKVLGIRNSDNGIQNIYVPHSAYWTVEGGNNVFHRNNIGLPGSDVHAGPAARYVFVLGSSFIEAAQVQPDSMATAVFQRLLTRKDPALQVLNLGHSGHDAYDNYFRCLYFSRRYKPEAVILVLQDLELSWLVHHPHPLTFTPPAEFGTEVQSIPTRLMIALRNASAFGNLLAEWRRGVKGDRGQGESAGASVRAPQEGSGNEKSPDDLGKCLEAFHAAYGEAFLVVSMMSDTATYGYLHRFCDNVHVPLTVGMIPPEDHLLGGSGHLAVRGNSHLGEILYESLAQPSQH